MWSVAIKKGTKCFISIQTLCKVTAYMRYLKEAEALKSKEYIELWHVGKASQSLPQHEECNNTNR